jgi:tRNA(fMet)-specific endonuclease VapC
MDFLSDTTLLIDLWREQDRPGAALRFAEAHRDQSVGLPWIVKGEFLRGARLAGHAGDQVRRFLDSFVVVWPDEATLETYARIYVDLRGRNAMIGPNDLWIAACAATASLPLITRNPAEFRRVEGLDVIDYTA